MKVAVVGSREFDQYEHFEFIESYLSREGFLKEDTEIVSGGARGVDSIAEYLAICSNIKFKCFPADWEKHGKSAGFIRNKEIVDYSDIIIAFWDYESSGTKSTIELARKADKEIHIVKLYKEGVK